MMILVNKMISDFGIRVLWKVESRNRHGSIWHNGVIFAKRK